MAAKLSELPTELYAAIIEHFDSNSVQPCILALTRAIPYAPIPLDRFFERITLRHQEQISQLYRRLRRTPEDATLVRAVSMESWVVDADVLINLLVLLPAIQQLTLFIGPNFAPEHLEELFQKPRSSLKHLSLRFRP